MSSLEQLKILVVDDEATIRSLIRQLLEQLGQYEVLAAENGQQALDLVQKNTFDCAFVDLMMPGPYGTELLDSILRQSPNTYLIIITGFASMKAVIDTMRHGALDFIPKPFALDDIRLALRRLLQKRRFAVPCVCADLKLQLAGARQMPLKRGPLQPGDSGRGTQNPSGARLTGFLSDPRAAGTA